METATAKAPKKSAKSPKFTVVKDDVWKGTQSLHAERIVKVGDLKLRAEVKRDAYDFQSYARVSAWTTKEGWEVVTTIPFERLACKGASPYGTVLSVWEALAAKDIDKLLALAVATLG